MARRKTTKRVTSEGVQGEGSYVVLRRLTVEETAERMDREDVRDAAQRKADAARRKTDANEELAASEKLTAEERDLVDEPSGSRYRDAIRYFADHIIAWNWADENENPLPLPSEDASVVDALTNDEAAFLGQALAGGSEEETKN